MIARLRKTAEPFGNVVRKRFGVFEYPNFGRLVVHHYATTFVNLVGNVLFRIREIVAA